MTSYKRIFERFTQKITDFKILDLTDDDVNQMMVGWLNSAISKFRRCENDLSLRNEDIQVFDIDLNDQEIEILSLLMVVEWLEPQMNSELYTSQFFGGKEEKFFSQANTLTKLMELQRKSFLRAQKLMRDYAYQNKIWSAKQEGV